MDTLKQVEIELKFPLLNSKELAETLHRIAKLKKQGDLQKDTYYTPAHRDFVKQKPISEWLRLRESKKGCSLNYKKWHTTEGEKTVSCDEYETKIDNILSLTKLLKNLDFKELIVVEKSRTSWEYKDVEISIDEVTGLGTYIEIEAQGDYGGFTNIEEAKKHLYTILKEIRVQVGEQDFEGYPHQLLKKKGLL